jgi:hypothetical protein
MLRKRAFVRVVASVRALLPEDWLGSAGKRFRRTMKAVSDFTAERNVRPSDLLDDGIHKVKGLANKEYADALKKFTDVENLKIEIELKRRSLESDLRKKEAEAHIAEINAVTAEIELCKKLAESGLALHQGGNGNLTIFHAGWNCDVTQLAQQKLTEPGRDV